MRLGLEHDGARWNTTTSMLLLLRCPPLPFYYGNGQHGAIPLSFYLLSSLLPPSPSLPFLSSTHTTCSSASLPLGINSTYAYLMCQSIQICRCLGTVCTFYNAAVRFLPPFPTQKPPLAWQQLLSVPANAASWIGSFWITRDGTICASLGPWLSAAGRICCIDYPYEGLSRAYPSSTQHLSCNTRAKLRGRRENRVYGRGISQYLECIQ